MGVSGLLDGVVVARSLSHIVASLASVVSWQGPSNF